MTINYGEIHFFYPCVIKSDDSIESIEQRILEGTLYVEKHRLAIQKSLNKEMAEAFNSLDNHDGSYVLDDVEDISLPDSIMSKFKYDTNDYILEIQDNPPKVYLRSKELDALTRRADKFAIEKDTAIEVYGREYVNSHTRFLLTSMSAKLVNGFQVHVQCILYLFDNNTAILKFELPIIDIEAELLAEGNASALVESFSSRWISEPISNFASFYDLATEYLVWLGQEINADIVVFGDDITNIILVDTIDKIDDVSKIEDASQEMLFRIIAAPVSLRKDESCLDIARDYLSKHSIIHRGIGYFPKSTGGCLSAIDETTSWAILSDLGFEEMLLKDSQDYCDAMESLALNIAINVEFSLILSLLAKAGNRDMLFKSQNELKDFDEVRIHFYENQMFLNSLQERCYGTVTEQFQQFREMMPHYFRDDLVAIQMDCINGLKAIQQDSEKRKREIRYTLFGLAAVLTFAFPAIIETLVMLRTSFLFRWLPSVSFITIKDIGTILWGFIFLALIVTLFRNSTLLEKLKVRSRSNQNGGANIVSR